MLEKQNQVTYSIIKKKIQYRSELPKPPYKYTKATISLAAHKKQQAL